MLTSITIQIKNVYGENKAYPVGRAAESFAAIANTKTLTRTTLAQVLAIGFSIVEVDRNGRAIATYGAAQQLPAIA